MKILVVDDREVVPHVFCADIDWMWVEAGGTPETVPEILVARNWAGALSMFEAHADNLVGVVTDALIAIETLNRAPDERQCGPALFWIVRRFSAHLPVVIYSMGGLNEYLFSAVGLDSMPPSEEGNWRFLATGITVEDLSWLEPMVDFAKQRAT